MVLFGSRLISLETEVAPPEGGLMETFVGKRSNKRNARALDPEARVLTGVEDSFAAGGLVPRIALGCATRWLASPPRCSPRCSLPARGERHGVILTAAQRHVSPRIAVRRAGKPGKASVSMTDGSGDQG